jgi:C-terminal processing protease CtpA/Prc
LATETTIAGWKQYLEDKNLSKESLEQIQEKVRKMEASKGTWVNAGDDEIDSSIQPRPFPQKVVILINQGGGSSTEEFLLAARQSAKVILAGQNTIGNLDYSNVVQAPFSCFPYTLRYATTRSRRLATGGGIDNKGIAPQYRLPEDADWIQEAIKILEK